MKLGLYRLALSGAFAGALALTSGVARADVSSWFYTGFGPGFLGGESARSRAVLELETGLGSPPAAFVVGGVFRTQTFFKEGTDLALLLRGATRGYVQGGFGLALDVGAFQRFWGVSSTGPTATLGFGGPWGVTLRASGGVGTHGERFAVATLGFDFARLTVYRTHGTNWFMNPFATDEQGRGPR